MMMLLSGAPGAKDTDEAGTQPASALQPASAPASVGKVKIDATRKRKDGQEGEGEAGEIGGVKPTDEEARGARRSRRG